MATQASQSPDAVANLVDTYHEYENTISVQPAPCDGTLKTLVTFDSTKMMPLHRWYTFKEGYSAQLLSWLQDQGILPAGANLRLLDPFCGVGTTLLSSQLSPREAAFAEAIGIERNPAIRFIADAKLRWTEYQPAIVTKMLDRLRRDVGSSSKDYAIPSLSTFTAVRHGDKRAFEPAVLQDLLYYREWIEHHCRDIVEYRFFMLAWTATIERASNTRKDGRALRLTTTDKPPDVKQLLIGQCSTMLDDICQSSSTSVEATAQVIGGDGRHLPFRDSMFTAICYSPPYLNNIDYSEVYKLELWLRGDVTTQEQFRALRLGTFRSHPSVLFPDTAVCAALPASTWIRRLKDSLLTALPKDRFWRMRQALFAGYIDDLLVALREQSRVAAPGAPIICVIGNSLHGGEYHVPVCTDLCIAAAAQAVGLYVDHLQIARQLPRRDNQNGWLRETIIVMHKPGA